jgi:hypothetical protein
LEAWRQSGLQEAADEFVASDSGHFVSSAVAVILPGKGYLFAVHGQQTSLGDGDPMGVTAEIINEVLGTSKRRLGINDPFLLVQRGEVMSESFGVA